MSGLEEKISEGGYRGDESDGVMPRALRYLFERVQQVEAEQAGVFNIRASFCEIYNEQVGGGRN